MYAKINEKCKKDLALGSLADITMVAKNSVLGASRAYENLVMTFTVNVFCGIQSDYKKYVWMEKCPFLILFELTTHPFFNMKQEKLDATPGFRFPTTHKIYKGKMEKRELF